MAVKRETSHPGSCAGVSDAVAYTSKGRDTWSSTGHNRWPSSRSRVPIMVTESDSCAPSDSSVAGPAFGSPS